MIVLVDVDQKSLAEEIVSANHQHLDLPEEIVNELNPHFGEIVLNVFVDLLQIQNQYPNMMYHLTVCIRVVDLMLELSEEFYFHVSKSLHFMHDFIMATV